MAVDLKVPGREGPGNPLTLLTQALDVIVRELMVMNAMTRAKQEHVYALWPTGEGFLVYCTACSHEEGRPVFPCLEGAIHGDQPPSSFTVEPPPVAVQEQG